MTIDNRAEPAHRAASPFHSIALACAAISSIGPAAQPRRRCLASPLATATIVSALAERSSWPDDARALCRAERRLPGIDLGSEHDLEPLLRLLAHVGAHLEVDLLEEVALAVEEGQGADEEPAQLVVDVARARR